MRINRRRWRHGAQLLRRRPDHRDADRSPEHPARAVSLSGQAAAMVAAGFANSALGRRQMQDRATVEQRAINLAMLPPTRAGLLETAGWSGEGMSPARAAPADSGPNSMLLTNTTADLAGLIRLCFFLMINAVPRHIDLSRRTLHPAAVPSSEPVIEGAKAMPLSGLSRRRAKRCGMPVVSRYDGASMVDR